jgi:hypothetical protein
MTEPNGAAADGVNPTILLAGKRWPIPLLGTRQNRSVVPAVARVMQQMRAIAETELANLTPEQRIALVGELPPGSNADAALRTKIWEITDFPPLMAHQMTDEVFDAITGAVFGALKRAHPEMSRDEFDDMPIPLLELIDAIGIIAQQTGMMRKVSTTDSSADPLASPGSSRSPSYPTGTR